MYIHGKMEYIVNLKVKAQKWGNSLGMRIPKIIAEELSLTDGTTLELEVDGKKLIVYQAKKNKFKLQDLLSLITPKNTHSETETGDAIGDETW